MEKIAAVRKGTAGGDYLIKPACAGVRYSRMIIYCRQEMQNELFS